MKIAYPLIIDGGLSNVLEYQGHDLNHKLWSAKLLDSNPEAIIQSHMAYLNAGAQCITTSSYQATIPGFVELGYSLAEAEILILRTVELAQEAIDRYMKSNDPHTKPLIAASIGPYGAYLADGSEYGGNYGISKDAIKEFHLSRIKLLDNSIADFFACETIPDYDEAKVLEEILLETKKPAWVSFSCNDEQTINDGTNIEKCIQLFVDHPNVFAIGVNCTHPKYVSKLIQNFIKHASNKKIIVYPNSGEVYNAKTKSWLGLSDPDQFVIMAKEWLELGADIIGGCCRIGPEHIKRISNIVKK